MIHVVQRRSGEGIGPLPLGARPTAARSFRAQVPDAIAQADGAQQRREARGEGDLEAKLAWSWCRTAIAYYVRHRSLDPSYVTSSSAASDRERIRSWVNRSLVKRGVWGSGLDTLLNRLREVLRSQGDSSFPTQGLETAMAGLGKALRFEEAEIAELLELRYGRPRTLATLAALHPGLDMTKAFHVDHVFPRSRFTAAKLTKAGIAADKLDEFIARVDALPNLQLLDGIPNIEKQDVMPAEWLAGPRFTSEQARQRYVDENDLVGLLGELSGFLDFYDARRERMAERLRTVLTAPIESTAPVSAMAGGTE